MDIYKKIMVAVDISHEADIVFGKAINLSEKYNSEVVLVRVVVENSYNLAPVIDTQLEENLVGRAENFLKELASKYNINQNSTHVFVGSIKAEIHKFAIDNDIELIILGTHIPVAIEI